MNTLAYLKPGSSPLLGATDTLIQCTAMPAVVSEYGGMVVEALSSDSPVTGLFLGDQVRLSDLEHAYHRFCQRLEQTTNRGWLCSLTWKGFPPEGAQQGVYWRRFVNLDALTTGRD